MASSRPEVARRAGDAVKRDRWARRAVLSAVAVVVVALVASAYVNARGPDADCSRSPQAHPEDAVGVPVARIREYLAQKYATEPRYVSPLPDGSDGYEFSVLDASGHHNHGRVRAERARRGGGWLIVTTNTCGD